MVLLHWTTVSQITYLRVEHLSCHQVVNLLTSSFLCCSLTIRKSLTPCFSLKPVEKIIFAVLYPILFVFGFIGNVAFLTVVAFVGKMRTLTNFYLVNLAVADLLFNILVLTFVTVSYVLSNGVRIADIGCTDMQCGIVNGAAYMTFFSSLCLVTLVTFDRFLAICHPIRYRIITTKKRAIKLVIIAWISGTAMATS